MKQAISKNEAILDKLPGSLEALDDFARKQTWVVYNTTASVKLSNPKVDFPIADQQIKLIKEWLQIVAGLIPHTSDVFERHSGFLKFSLENLNSASATFEYYLTCHQELDLSIEDENGVTWYESIMKKVFLDLALTMEQILKIYELAGLRN